ncbi:hypothetical protein L6452_20870 [Arctium lappa]|uniref:Uncharacterized protein n=1 Tax=Arctium lappa TaxID=4217 RepID=A0ACB9BDF9_ARCLA|nr:hypothetical protein L6452_20870 [Arctium lappa]
MVLKKDSTAIQVWNNLETLFRDNKDAKSVQINSELRNIVMGDLSITAYCTKIKALVDLFANLDPDSAIPDKHLLIYTINGLSSKFDSVTNIIRYRSPLPTFLETREIREMDAGTTVYSSRVAAANNQTTTPHPPTTGGCSFPRRLSPANSSSRRPNSSDNLPGCLDHRHNIINSGSRHTTPLQSGRNSPLPEHLSAALRPTFQQRRTATPQLWNPHPYGLGLHRIKRRLF